MVEKALKKLEDQLTCPICLNFFTNSKLLQCFHIFCRGCLEQIVHDDQSICCPKCRQTTLLPANGLPGLQSTFHVSYLFEIQGRSNRNKKDKRHRVTSARREMRRDSVVTVDLYVRYALKYTSPGQIWKARCSSQRYCWSKWTLGNSNQRKRADHHS